MSAKKATKNTQDNAAHGGCSAVSCSPSYYAFRNRDGQTFQLRGDLTMEDLVRMGYGDIRLVQPETPLNPHEWRCDPPKSPVSFTVLHEVNGEWRCWAVFKHALARKDARPKSQRAEPRFFRRTANYPNPKVPITTHDI